MRTPVSQHHTTVAPTVIVVVDANPSDYVALAPLVEAGEIDLRFLLSGRSALRESRRLKAPLWMINVGLPDHSGFDVQEMCFGRKTRELVLMVADQYSSSDEIRALKLGVANYFCKPVDPAWLYEYLVFIQGKAGGVASVAAAGGNSETPAKAEIATAASRWLLARAARKTARDTAANSTSHLY